MASPKKLEMTALAGFLVQGAFALTCFALAAQSGAASVAGEFWHLLPGLLVWFLVLAHGRQRRLARQEREELERLRETRLSEEIFEETELDTMRASSGLLIFEKYLVPFFSLVLSGLLGLLAYRRFTVVLGGELPEVKNAAAVAAGMVFIGFVGFLIGKYAAGLAQNREFRLLRAAAGYMLGNVIVCVLIAIDMAMYYFEVTWGETVVCYLIPGTMALVAVEILLNMVLDIYRPRVEGQETRPPYDSRLLGLFAEPEGVLRTVAATLDYQFGFKISETWFYRFMERAILPLILVQVFSLWMLTTLMVVDKDQVAFVERFGRPYVSKADAAKGLKATVFQPGFYLKAPWPFEVARHVPAYRTHVVALGKIYEAEGPVVITAPVMKHPDVILWNELHVDPKVGFEANFLVPSPAASAEPAPTAAPASSGEAGGLMEGLAIEAEARKAPQVNLARLEADIHYRVKRKPDGSVDEAAAFNYYYQQADIERHVMQATYRAICHVAASQDFLRWVAEDRAAVNERLRQMVQDSLDSYNLGLEVVYFGIPLIHPPAEVAGAFSDVVTALQNRESLRYQGEAEYSKTVREAEAKAAEAVNRARGYAASLTIPAEAAKNEFLTQLSVYKRAPMVYMFRRYFDAIETALKGQKIYIVPRGQREVNIIDLQEKMRPELLEFK